MLNITSSYNRPRCMDDGQEIFNNVTEKLKAYYAAGLLQVGKTYFFGTQSNLFCSHDGKHIRTYRMRDNWNGWHDVAAWTLPDFTPVGSITHPSPETGIHRTTISIS